MPELAVFDESVDAYPMSVRHFFIHNDHRDHRTLKVGFTLSQLGKEIGEHCHMSQAVSHTATIQPVSVNLQLEGRALPFSRVRRHHIEMRADKSDCTVGYTGGRHEYVAT